MSDATLRRLLRNALGGRKAPADVRARVLARLRCRPGLVWLTVAAAAALAIAAGVFAFVSTEKPLPADLAVMIKEHREAWIPNRSDVGSMSPDDVSKMIHSATDRTVNMPGLRDAGFGILDAHRCDTTNRAHVIYKNYWLMVSCFVARAGQIDLSGGEKITREGIDLVTFKQDKTSAVAIREGGITKVWVGDLRPEQLTAIAVDAEQKRHHVQKTVFQVAHHPCVSRPMEALLLKTPGIEHVTMNHEKEQAEIWIDRRRVSPDQITAMLVLNGIEAHPMPIGGE